MILKIALTRINTYRINIKFVKKNHIINYIIKLRKAWDRNACARGVKISPHCMHKKFKGFKVNLSVQEKNFISA